MYPQKDIQFSRHQPGEGGPGEAQCHSCRPGQAAEGLSACGISASLQQHPPSAVNPLQSVSGIILLYNQLLLN